MFEVNGTYANRKGKYSVLSIDGPRMTVRYEDGSTADLSVDIQYRIWENIVAEQEARDKRSAKRANKKKSIATVRHYIKVVNVTPGDELAFPGWEDRMVMATTEEVAQQISKGDRLIYFAPEGQVFFAVATITGDPITADPKKYTYTIPVSEAIFFPIDVDAETGSLDKGVTLDSVELESCPDFAANPVPAETFCPISEDDFELLAELLAEISEEVEEEDDEDIDVEEFDEDDD